MKKQAWMLAAALAVIVGMLGYEKGLAEAEKTIVPPKTGVVDVTAILENSQKHRNWQQKMRTQEEEMRAEFQKMKKELEAIEANIKTRKPGSADYLNLREEFAQKKALLESKNEFYEDRVTLEMQQWTEALYKEFMQVVEKVAQRKGLDLVLAKEKLDLPAPSLRDFMLTVKTNKVIYSRSGLDITEEVLAELDNQE